MIRENENADTIEKWLNRALDRYIVRQQLVKHTYDFAQTIQAIMRSDALI